MFDGYDFRHQLVAFVWITGIMVGLYLIIDYLELNEYMWVWMIVGFPVVYFVKKWTKKSS